MNDEYKPRHMAPEPKPRSGAPVPVNRIEYGPGLEWEDGKTLLAVKAHRYWVRLFERTLGESDIYDAFMAGAQEAWKQLRSRFEPVPEPSAPQDVAVANGETQPDLRHLDTNIAPTDDGHKSAPKPTPIDATTLRALADEMATSDHCSWKDAHRWASCLYAALGLNPITQKPQAEADDRCAYVFGKSPLDHGVPGTACGIKRSSPHPRTHAFVAPSEADRK